jgi:hypothetical protein
MIPTRLDNLMENIIWAADGSEIDLVVARGKVLKRKGKVMPFSDGSTAEEICVAVQTLSEKFAKHMETALEISGTGAHK